MVSSLQAQPFDILNLVVTFLDSPKDLLALSLTSRQFYRLTCPHHIDFRYIRCDPNRLSLWEALFKHGEISKRFRRIELYNEAGSVRGGRTVLPQSWEFYDVEEDLHQARAYNQNIDPFINALGKMENLLRFSWVAEKGLTVPQRDAFPAIFSTLSAACPLLQEIEVNVRGDSGPQASQILMSEDVELPETSFISVKHILLKFRASSSPPLIKYLTDLIISRCPSLIDLHFDLRSPILFDFAPIFIHANWPLLKRLFLVIESPEAPDPLPEETMMGHMKNFFGRNQSIECLYFGRRPTLLPGVLSVQSCPRLRSLLFYDHHYDRVKVIPPDLARQLTYIAGPAIPKVLLTYGKGGMPFLQGAGGRVYDGELDTMADVLPAIEHLDFWEPMGDYGEETEDSRVEQLRRFTNLKYLAGFVLVLRTDDTENFPIPLLVKLASVPSLQFVEICQYEPKTGSFRQSTRWVGLNRDANGEFAGFFTIEHPKTTIPSTIRGGFFEDLDG